MVYFLFGTLPTSLPSLRCRGARPGQASDCQLVQNHLSACDAQDLSDHPDPPGRPLLLPASTNFVRHFVVKNTGSSIFPPNTKLRITAGADILRHKHEKFLDLPCLEVGDSHGVALELTSPAIPGVFETQWRVYNEGYYFGEVFRVRLEVREGQGPGQDPRSSPIDPHPAGDRPETTEMTNSDSDADLR